MKEKLEGMSSPCVLFSEASALQRYCEVNVRAFSQLVNSCKESQ